MARTGLLLLALAAMLVACESPASKTLASMLDVDTGAMVTLEEAIGIAQGEVPDGFAIEAELELEDDDEDEPPAYEVVFFIDGSNELVEVEVHAFTGEVLEIEVEADEEDDD